MSDRSASGNRAGAGGAVAWAAATRSAIRASPRRWLARRRQRPGRLGGLSGGRREWVQRRVARLRRRRARGPAAPAARAAWAVAAAAAVSVEAAEEEGVVERCDHMALTHWRLGTAAGVLGLLAGCGDAKRSASAAPRRLDASAEDTTPPQLFATPGERGRGAGRRGGEVRRAGPEGDPRRRAARTWSRAEDTVQDRRTATAFAAQAREKQRLRLDSTKTTAVLSRRTGDWPLPDPDRAAATASGPSTRRPGARRSSAAASAATSSTRSRSAAATSRRSDNTPWTRHDGALVNQYAQRVISTPGKQDGLAWRTRTAPGQGPVGEEIARAIARRLHEDRTSRITATTSRSSRARARPRRWDRWTSWWTAR